MSISQTASNSHKDSSPRNVKGVVSDDEDKMNKSRYHLWKQKYVGDQIRDPQPLGGSKKPKPGEASGSSSLSTALGYIITPVKYLASALSYSSTEPEKPPDKPKYKLGYASKNQSHRPTEPAPRQTAVQEDAMAVDGSQKAPEPPLRALKTIPLSEITAPNPAPAAKTRTTTQSKDKDKDKKSAQKQKPGNNKKVHEIKKSQSQQIKGSPKVYKSYSPPRNGDTFPAISSTKLISASDLRIVQSNTTSFRIVSREDVNANSDQDAHASELEVNPALASRSNNSNIVCQLSAMRSPLNDELTFVDDPPQTLVAYRAHNTIHSLSNQWAVPEATSNKYGFASEFGRLRNRSRVPETLDLPNMAGVLENVPCDREAIETIFSGNLLIQCTPTQLMAGHKSQSRTSMTQESVHIDSSDLRDTLLANNSAQRFTSPKNKWQPLKDYEGDSNLVIVPTGPLPKKSSPVSTKSSPKNKPKSLKIFKTKSPATTKRKTTKQDPVRLQSPSSSQINDSKFSPTAPKPIVTRPASESGSGFKRTTIVFHTAPRRREEIKKEDIKKEEFKRESIKREEIKKEETKREEIKKETTKKTTPLAVSPAAKTAAITATAAVSETVTKVAASAVAAPVTKDDRSVHQKSLPAASAASERYASSSTSGDTWLSQAIRSLSPPKRTDPPPKFYTDVQQSPHTTESRQSPGAALVSPPTTTMSPKGVTITSAAASMTEVDTSVTQGGVSRTAASAVREALKFTSAVREAMKMSRPVNMLGKKNLSSLTYSRAEIDQEKQEDYPTYFSVAATLHGEFP